MIGMFRLADSMRNDYFSAPVRENDAVAKAAHEEWDEVGDESENDLAGLALSFLIVQVVRFSISGVLPSATGTEHPAEKHSVGDIVWLYGFSVFFAAIMTIAL